MNLSTVSPKKAEEIKLATPEAYLNLCRIAYLIEANGSIHIDIESQKWKDHLSKYPPVRDDKQIERTRNWKNVASTWHAAVSYAKSKLSALGGKVTPLPIMEMRASSCHNQPCPARAFDEKAGFHFCSECACGPRPEAALSEVGSTPDKPRLGDMIKLKFSYPYLECPRQRPGFSNANSDAPKMTLVLRSEEGIGDLIGLILAVRDLHRCHPRMFNVIIKNWAAEELLKGNPLAKGEVLPKLPEGTKALDGELPVYYYINEYPKAVSHFATQWHRKLAEQVGLPINVTEIGGTALYLTEEEKALPRPYNGDPFWMIFTGSHAMTTKWWNPRYYGRVVSALGHRFKFIHVGGENQWNPEIEGAERLIGAPLREIMRLMYWCDGVISSISAGMHLAATVETRPNMSSRRPCVVIAGGKEDPHFVHYPKHRFLSNIGRLPCCAQRACYRDKVDRDCLMPTDVGQGVQIASCMDLIPPQAVVDAVLGFYYQGRPSNERDLEVPQQKIA